MNKKGFTLVELLVTIFVVSLVLSLSVYSVNKIINNSTEKSKTIALENIKKSANLFSKEYFDDIIWINNQSCISVEQLISQGYLRKDEISTVTDEYIIVNKDNNNTIISEETSDGTNAICTTIIDKKVPTPTSGNICNDLRYNGTSQNLIKDDIGDIYEIPSITGTNAGSYKVSIGLKDGYHWKDNSTGVKEVECIIKKAIPTLSLSSTNQPAEQTKPTDVTLTSNIDGDISIKSSNSEYATATSTGFNGTSGNYTSTITINNQANREINTYITITVIPKDQNNYQSASVFYTIGKITDIKTAKPTATTYCKDPYYNSLEQTLTKEADIGYTLYDNKATEVGTYTITAKLQYGYEWSDGSTDDITFDCKIEPLTYIVKYNGNGSTSGSTTNSNHTYGTETNLTANGFKKTGYTFAGWATTTSGTVKYQNKALISNLINPKTEPNGTIVNLYAKWTANTYTVTYNCNGGGGTTASSTHTYDTAKNLTTNACTKTGYTFAGWATSSSGSVKYSNKQSVSNLTTTNGGTVTLYAKWTANTYTVKYNGNGSTSGSTSSSNHTYGTAKTLTANGFKKTGYTFSGWATSSSGSVKYSNKQSVSNLTTTNGGTVNLYAKWTDKTSPTCTVKATNSNIYRTSGVDVTVTCSDSGSGCKTGTQKGTNLKSDKTYTVYDNAGNKGTCKADIISYYNDCNSSSTYWRGTCIVTSTSGLKSDTAIDRKVSKEQCESACTALKPTNGWTQIACESYLGCNPATLYKLNS